MDTVLQDLMERGIQTAGDDRIGKTIIFAQNKRHAEFIRERFGKLYPQLETQYPGFIQRVVCDDAMHSPSLTTSSSRTSRRLLRSRWI